MTCAVAGSAVESLHDPREDPVVRRAPFPRISSTGSLPVVRYIRSKGGPSAVHTHESSFLWRFLAPDESERPPTWHGGVSNFSPGHDSPSGIARHEHHQVERSSSRLIHTWRRPLTGTLPERALCAPAAGGPGGALRRRWTLEDSTKKSDSQPGIPILPSLISPTWSNISGVITRAG